MEVLADALPVIVLQYMNVFHQPIANLKHIQCYRSIISQKSWKRNYSSETITLTYLFSTIQTGKQEFIFFN